MIEKSALEAVAGLISRKNRPHFNVAKRQNVGKIQQGNGKRMTKAEFLHAGFQRDWR